MFVRGSVKVLFIIVNTIIVHVILKIANDYLPSAFRTFENRKMGIFIKVAQLYKVLSASTVRTLQ